ncbi:MAG: hypothetical protein ABIT61_09000 [Steroidobacteraceae bacterium]
MNRHPMNGSNFRLHNEHSPSKVGAAIDAVPDTSVHLPFQPLVEAWDMLTAAAIVRLRWTAARFGANGRVPLALSETIKPRPCSWLVNR